MSVDERHHHLGVGIMKETRESAMTVPVATAMPYDPVACPHRRTMALFSGSVERDKSYSFVEYIWGMKSLCEKEVIAHLGVSFHDFLCHTGETTGWPLGVFPIEVPVGYFSLSRNDSSFSGVAFIERFHMWTDADDPTIRQPSIEYKEDGYRTMRVIRDVHAMLPIISGDAP